MSFFISDAVAQTAQTGQQAGLFEAIFPFAILFVVFYFLLIRPQQKRAKEHQQMTNGLGKGDEVTTQGGLYGRIVEAGNDHVELQLADNVQVKVQRAAITAVMPKGTIKKL